MSVPGSLVEVQLQSRGSQVVGNHSSGATVLLVDDPTPFGDDSGQVFVTGNSYTYTSATEVPDVNDPSDTNAQLALSSGLAAAVSDLTPVEVWNGTQILDDVVLMVSTGAEGDPAIPVTLTAEQRAFWEGRLGPVDPPIAVSLSDDLTMLLDAPGWTPSVNGAAIVGFPDPAAVAVDPPAASPAITTVQGNATGLTVVTAPILPTTLLDYYVNGVLVAADQRTTVINLTTSDGVTPLAMDTDYTVTVQAHNAATDDDPTLLPAASAGVTDRLDSGVTAAQVVAILQAGFILAGTIQVGSSMTLDGVGGITITQTDGRQTYFRADGSGNQLVGTAILDSLIANGNVAINGQTNGLNGLLTLASGVSDPTSKPGVTSAGWDSVTFADGKIPTAGMFDNVTEWVSAFVFFGGSVQSFNKSTGALGIFQPMPSNFYPYGGVVKVGASWYVLGKDYNRSANWWVYVFNSSWLKTGEWAPSAASSESLSLGVDGSGLLIAKRTGADNLYVSNYSTAGAESSFVLCGTWAGAEITGVVKAAVDTATVRFVVGSRTGGIRVFNTGTGARVTGEEWTRATGNDVRGLVSDGTNWFTQDGSKFWKYTNLIGTYDFAFTWLDDQSGQTGFPTLAETKASTVRTVAPTKRSKWTISLPSPPPDDLTNDGANTARIYAVTTGGTLVRQASLTEGTYSQTFSTLTASGSAPPSSNGFASRAGAIGRLASTAIVSGTSNPKLDFRGSGDYRLAGHDLDDLGDVTLTSILTTGAVTYRVKNGYVTIRANGNVTAPVGATALNSAAIPSAMRPSTSEAGGCRLAGFAGTITVDTAGIVTVDNQTGASRGSVRATLVYPLP